MPCSQWWPSAGRSVTDLIFVVENEMRDCICDKNTLSKLKSSEIKELETGLNKLFRQWLIRNNRIPNGVYFDDEIIYKVVNGKAVKIGKAI